MNWNKKHIRCFRNFDLSNFWNEKSLVKLLLYKKRKVEKDLAIFTLDFDEKLLERQFLGKILIITMCQILHEKQEEVKWEIFSMNGQPNNTVG